MQHDGVADKGGLADPAALDPGGAQQAVDDAVDGLEDGAAEGVQLVLPHRAEAGAGDDVGAVDGLAVELGGDRQLGAGIEVQERANDGGGADVEGEPERRLGRGVAGFEIDGAAADQGDSNRPVAGFADDPGEAPQRRQRGVDAARDGGQFVLDASPVEDRVLEVGGGGGDDVPPDVGAECDLADAGALDGAELGLDQRMGVVGAFDERMLAGHPPAGLQLGRGKPAAIDPGGRGRLVAFDQNPAFAAGAASGADGLKVNTSGGGGIENGRAGGGDNGAILGEENGGDGVGGGLIHRMDLAGERVPRRGRRSRNQRNYARGLTARPERWSRRA